MLGSIQAILLVLNCAFVINVAPFVITDFNGLGIERGSSSLHPPLSQNVGRNGHITLGASRRRQRNNNGRNYESLLDKNPDGDIFKLNPFSGRIEFGNAGSAAIKLDNGDEESITRWLKDVKQVALSIWDTDMIKELGNDVFQLDLMTLQLVTIQLKPSVDVKMWTEEIDTVDGGKRTVFKLQSVGFDPNIQVLPFVGVPDDALKLEVEVAGELYVDKDGKGLSGRIGFISTGNLPPPMRMVPEPVLRAAITTINRTVSAFAILGFERGVTQNFSKYLLSAKTRV